MTPCPKCRHDLSIHSAAYSSPAGDDGTMGKNGFTCAEYWGCGCWLDEWPMESSIEPTQQELFP